MAQKRKFEETVEKFSSTSCSSDEDDDYDFFNINRKKQYILDSSDSDGDISQIQSTRTSTSRIGEEIYIDDDSVDCMENFGPQCSLSSESKPIEFFNLFFDSSLWSLVVKETNKNAEYLNNLPRKKQSSKVENWKPVTVLEMRAFIAVLLEMGITKRPNMCSYWSEDSRSIPWFRKMFSRKRFQQIFKYFHLIDNSLCFPPDNKNYDPCVQFDPLIRHANKVFKLYYTPHKELTIDKLLVGSSCHSSRTNMNKYQNKYERWGINFWMLCDASSKYCLTFYYYKGPKVTSEEDGEKLGIGYNIAVKLLEEGNYLNKKHHIFVNNFFSSVGLANYLYSKDTYLTGAIKQNKIDISDNLKIDNVNKVKYFKKSNLLFCAYYKNKNMKVPEFLISTHEDQNVIIMKRRDGRECIRPSIVHSYCSFIGGVCEYDTMLYTYFDTRKPVKFWKKVALNIIGRMILNAYLIYKEIVREKSIPQIEFISKIIFEIECEWLKKDNKQVSKSTDKEQKKSGLIKLPGRNLRQCSVCSIKTNKKRSHLICVQCKKGVHPICFDKHKCN